MRLCLDQTLSLCKKTRLDQTLEKYMCLLLDQTLEHMDDEFLATAYPKVHENWKAHNRRTCKSAKRRCYVMVLLGQLIPTTKDDVQSLKNHGSRMHLLPNTPALTQCEGHVSDWRDTDNAFIFRKAQPSAQTDKTSLHTAVNMWIRNLVIRNHVGDLQLGIENYQTKINLERPNWDAADYYFKEDYADLMGCDKCLKSIGSTWLKTFICSSTIRAWRLGSGQRMTREEAKTSSLRSRKDYRSGGSFEV
ncbi:hypothetical protein Tco_0767771 [Tanacetum coccineum]